MKKEFEDILAEKYIFMRKKENVEEQIKNERINDLYSAFGIETGDGWFKLIDEMCENIMRVYNDAGIELDIEVDQVKEKFAGLRFYYHFKGRKKKIHAIDFLGQGTLRLKDEERNIDKLINDIVHTAEENSYHICEICGNFGRVRKDLPWIRTLCDSCYEDKVAIPKMRKGIK